MIKSLKVGDRFYSIDFPERVFTCVSFIPPGRVRYSWISQTGALLHSSRPLLDILTTAFNKCSKRIEDSESLYGCLLGEDIEEVSKEFLDKLLG